MEFNAHRFETPAFIQAKYFAKAKLSSTKARSCSRAMSRSVRLKLSHFDIVTLRFGTRLIDINQTLGWLDTEYEIGVGRFQPKKTELVDSGDYETYRSWANHFGFYRTQLLYASQREELPTITLPLGTVLFSAEAVSEWKKTYIDKKYRAFGHSLSIAEWAAKMKISGKLILDRLARGVPFKDAVSEYPKVNAKRKTLLTEDEVKEIHRLRATGMTWKQISEELGHAYSTVHAIGTGRLWQHLYQEPTSDEK